MPLRYHAPVLLGALLLGPVVQPASAQVSLQIWDGTAWATSLDVTRIPTLLLRWSHNGAENYRGAVWQVSFARSPAAKVHLSPQELAGEQTITLQLVDRFYPFQILAPELPQDLPQRFHIRVVVSPKGGSREASNWVPIRRIEAY